MRNALLALTLTATAMIASGRDATPEELAILKVKSDYKMNRFPIGFWNYVNLGNPEQAAHQQKADVEQWHQAGFTLPISPFFDSADPAQVAHIGQMLDWVAARDMKMIVWDNRAGAPEGAPGDPAQEFAFRKSLAAAIADFGGHPGMFGFMVGDEPTAATAPRFCHTSRVQRETAPELTPFSNLFPWWPEAEAIVGTTDGWPAYLDRMIRDGDLRILCYDHYGQLAGPTGIEGYFKNLKLYRDAAMRHQIPFWTTLGCVGHWRCRVPDRDDIRWQFNTAICSGAGGIMWFDYYLREPESNFRMAPVDVRWKTTPVYDDLSEVHYIFHRRYGDLFNRLVSTRVMFYPKGCGDFDSFASDSLVRGVQIVSSTGYDDAPEDIMIGEFIDREGNEYVMLVNASQTESLQVKAEFSAPASAITRPSWHGPHWERCWDLHDQDNGNATLTDWLAPGQEWFFRFGRHD